MKSYDYYMKKAKKTNTYYQLFLLLEKAADDTALTLDDFTALNDYINIKILNILY